MLHYQMTTETLSWFPGFAVFWPLPMPFGYPALPGYPLNTTAAEPGVG